MPTPDATFMARYFKSHSFWNSVVYACCVSVELTLVKNNLRTMVMYANCYFIKYLGLE